MENIEISGIIVLLVGFTWCLLFFSNALIIARRLYFRYINRKRYNKTLRDYSYLQPLHKEGAYWGESKYLISHALGGVAGNTHTNTKEAFERSCSDGLKIFEVDVALTSDGIPVLRHHWELGPETKGLKTGERPSYDQYMKSRICYKYYPLDLEWFCKKMLENEDYYVIIDIADYLNDNEKFLECFKIVLSSITGFARKNECTNIFKRFIIQIYDQETYSLVLKHTDKFENLIYTFYRLKDKDYVEIAEFCVKHNINTVAISKYEFNEEVFQLFNHLNIHVWVYTVNSIMECKTLLEMGIDGVYTDFLIPEDIILLNDEEMKQ